MLVGVDLGSRTIKVAAIEAGRLVDAAVAESGFAPHRQARELIRGYHPDRVIATGYGRHLAQRELAADVVTEIKAHALGARYFFPACRTVLDVGGQDAKAIALDEGGKVARFQMNDKCAAGTGRFLEIMAASLGIPLAEFGGEALQGADDIRVTGMCTVFAESEVVSLKNRGASPRNIARAVHRSIVERLGGMLHRLGHGDEIVFTGGVAKNRAMTRLLGDTLEIAVLVPDPPDIVGALGAALSGASA